MAQPTDYYKSTEKELEILVVDDDKITCLLHYTKLKRIFSHSISTHPNGEKALQHIQSQSSEDKSFLVLLDLNMPVMNGWEFLEASNQLSLKGDIFIIIVSSTVDTSERKRALSYPQVLNFCMKPFEEGDIRKIKELPELTQLR